MIDGASDEENIQATMKLLGVSRRKARQILAVEKAASDGDRIAIDECESKSSPGEKPAEATSPHPPVAA